MLDNFVVTAKMSSIGNARKSLSELKMEIYQAKRKSMFAWFDEFLDSHDKLVIAGWHRAVIGDIVNRYKDISVKIQGGMTAREKQKAEDMFQKDESIKVAILNYEAGGEGLTLTASADEAIVEIPDTPGQLIQVTNRIHRIGQKSDKITTHFLFAAGTIEEDIANRLEQNTNSLNAIIDGFKSNDVYGFDDFLIGKYSRRNK